MSGSISQIIERIANARFVITHDTGFAHVAGLYSKPQVVIFGPTNPEFYLPENRHAMAYVNSDRGFAECMPCGKKMCSRNDARHCLKAIDERVIVDLVREFVPSSVAVMQ